MRFSQRFHGIVSIVIIRAVSVIMRNINIKLRRGIIGIRRSNFKHVSFPR